jgi:hypothetical protein
LALTTRNLYSWAGDIPLDIFNEYVLPYANVNEVQCIVFFGVVVVMNSI